MLVYEQVDESMRTESTFNFGALADEVDDVFPGSRKLAYAGGTASWLDQPYSRGTYLAYDRGQVVKYWRALRAPLVSWAVTAG